MRNRQRFDSRRCNAVTSGIKNSKRVALRYSDPKSEARNEMHQGAMIITR